MELVPEHLNQLRWNATQPTVAVNSLHTMDKYLALVPVDAGNGQWKIELCENQNWLCWNKQKVRRSLTLMIFTSWPVTTGSYEM